MAVVLDSNIFIAYFREEELLHKKAINIIENTSEIIILDYVILEIYTVLLLRESQEIANQAIEWITQCPKIQAFRLTNNEIKSTIAFLSQCTSKISFIDASLLIIAKERNFELETFDEELKKIIKSYT